MKIKLLRKGASFRNNYLALFILLSFSFTASAQVYQNDPAYGRSIERYEVRKALHIPTFCGVPNLTGDVLLNKSAIAFDSCNNRLYYYNPKDSSWNIAGSGGGGSCDTCISTIVLSPDSTKLIFLKVNGDTAKIVDWTGGGGGSYTLPIASSSTLGGVKIGNNLTIDGSGKLSADSTVLYGDDFIYFDADTAKFKYSALPRKLTYSNAVDTNDIHGSDIPTLDMVNARMGGGGYNRHSPTS